MQAALLLANGMGGFDWAGLGLIAAYLGVEDVEGLIDALRVIKSFKAPDEPAPGAGPAAGDDDILNLR